MTDTGAGFLLFIMAVLLLVLYFIPSISAYRVGHHNKDAILMLNLFLGWTLLGWVAAAVWASTKVESSQGNKSIPLKQKTGLKDKLSELEQLRGDGLITEEEYKAKRASILESH